MQEEVGSRAGREHQRWREEMQVERTAWELRLREANVPRFKTTERRICRKTSRKSFLMAWL